MVKRRAHGCECPTYSALTSLKVLAPWVACRHGQRSWSGASRDVFQFMSDGRGRSLSSVGLFHFRWSFRKAADHPLIGSAKETYFWFGSGGPLPLQAPKKVVQRNSAIPAAYRVTGGSRWERRRLGGRPAECHQRLSRPKSSHADTVAVGKPK
jgi:hypothetical protein